MSRSQRVMYAGRVHRDALSEMDDLIPHVQDVHGRSINVSRSDVHRLALDLGIEWLQRNRDNPHLAPLPDTKIR